QRIRGSATGSNSHHHIILSGLALGHVFAPAGTGIFTVFGGVPQGFIASGNHILNGPGISVEGWGTLSGIERGKATAGACAYVNQPSAAANRIGNGVNGLGDLGESLLHGSSYFLIFVVND